jgi:hypothetical protein
MLKIQTPASKGNTSLDVYLLCDAVSGLDQQYAVDVLIA